MFLTHKENDFMTKAEKIKSLTIDELAGFIEQLDVNKVISRRQYCQNVCPIRNEDGFLACDPENLPCRTITDKECIIAWLESEVK